MQYREFQPVYEVRSPAYRVNDQQMQLNYFEKLRIEHYNDVLITDISEKTSNVTPEKLGESKKMSSDDKLAAVAKHTSYDNVFTGGSVTPVPITK